MGRQLYRSARKFMVEVMRGLSLTSEMPQATIFQNVAMDDQEIEPVAKTLNVLAMQGHIIKTGEGENATYRLDPSGQTLLDALGGA